LAQAESPNGGQNPRSARVGRSCGKSFVYIGAGPALFRTQNRINSATPYADIRHERSAPASFSSSQWVWGGARQVGVDYFLRPTWFLDVNYTLAMSASYDTCYS